MHIGSDTQGRVHSIIVTDASVHDSIMIGDFIHGEESELYGDKAYANAQRKEAYESAGVTWVSTVKPELVNNSV